LRFGKIRSGMVSFDGVERQSFVGHKFEQRQWRVENCIAMMEKSVNLNSIFQVFSSELNQIIFPTCYQVQGYWLFCFRKKSLYSLHTFIRVASRCLSWTLGIFNRGDIAVERGKQLKSLCSSHSLLSKSSLQYFVIFHNISHRLI
jgi:hypothetical protein